MKKIINNKVYDTATAKCVASWDNGVYGKDFNRLAEALYLKKTGEYFLFGEGGPMTQYAISRGDNEWTGGERIIPLTYDTAREWAQEKLDGSEYEAIFGPVAEDDSVESIYLSGIPRSVASRIRQEAQPPGCPWPR